MSAVKISCSNFKGGIGKSTTALALADGLAKKGKKVLLIDADAQQSATGIYNAKSENVSTLADIMYYGTDATECIQHTSLGDIIAADKALTDADTQIKPDADRFYHLSDACKTVDEMYDFIICDCPPGNGVMLGNVLSYVDFVIMPITCDKFGIQGMTDFVDVMGMYTKRINPGLKILGVLIVKYKGRQNLTRDLEDNLIPSLVSQMNTKLFNTKIRESVKCQEAQALGKSVFDHDPKCTTSVDYKNLIEELLEEIK